MKKIKINFINNIVKSLHYKYFDTFNIKSKDTTIN